MTEQMKPYEVKQISYDASRPYSVVAAYRSFNRVIARYQDRAAAVRRARDLNRNASPALWALAAKRDQFG
jgi:hypothetical protein